MQGAFRTATSETNYYDLLIPQGSSTYYWLASRCVNTYSSGCDFGMLSVYSGDVDAYNMYGSYDGTNSDSRALFSVVSLNSGLITGDATSGFTVNGN